MSANLRIIEIPPNGKNLPEGTWFAWPELRAVLLDRGLTELVDELSATLEADEFVSSRERIVR